MMTEEKKLVGSEGGIIAGDVHIALIPLAADEYHNGMPLSFTAPSYGYQSNVAAADAFYCGHPQTRRTDGNPGDAVVGGEISEAGIVDDSGNKVTITEANRKALRANGFYPK